jgi:hypothetical protein
MRRRDLSKIILACPAGLALRPQYAYAEGAAPRSDARTPAEVKAGVAPTNAEYPPGDVRRYGAKGNGVTNDAPAFQSALDVARIAGGEKVYTPVGAGGAVHIPAPDVFYLLTNALDCTFAGRENQHGITIRGEAGPSTDTPAIIARHNGHVFDLTGCDGAVLEDLNIGTDASTNPETCFFLARNSFGGSAGYHRFRNVRVHGKFKTAILYNYGSESNVLSECVWCNESAAAGTKVAVFSSHNIVGLTSAFGAIAKGGRSCLDHQIFGGAFINTSGDAAADVLYLDAANSLKIFGPWMAAGVHSNGRALIYVDSTNGASSLGEVYGLQGEVGSTQKYGFYFDGQSVSIPTGWTIDGCYLPNAKNAIFAAPNTTLDNFHIRNVMELASHGLSAAGVVQNSTISSGALLLAIGKSRRNALIGDSSRWTIGSRDHDSWMDSGAANKTWNPGTGNLTVRGRLTVDDASCVFHGPLVTVCTTLTATTSIECAAGVTLTGLPAAASARSALVNVSDARTGTSLGSGMVSGLAITLPAISATPSIVISASYFSA